MNILIVVAHPDDEILGCGGTICKLRGKDNKIFLLILGEGVKSRDGWVQKDYEVLRKNIIVANKVIGVPEKNIFVFDFPDNRFDSVPLLSIVKTIEKVKDMVKPDVVFTHTKYCLNIDHKRTYEAVVVATRPMVGETVKTILSFEIPSSTEWGFSNCFNPNVFYDVKETIDKKLSALKKYGSEIREYPHPRSLYNVYSVAQMWGVRVGVPFAEAFELVRMIM